MKRLRILNGRHAGATQDLGPGIHRIGADTQDDVVISDWTCGSLELCLSSVSKDVAWVDPVVSEETFVRGRYLGAADHLSDFKMSDFAPREFDGIVLCMGPASAMWPSDAALLEIVFQASPAEMAHHSSTPRRSGRLGLRTALAAVVLIAGVTGAYQLWRGEFDPKVPVQTAEAARATLQQKLDQSQRGALSVSTEQSALIVTGLVETSKDADDARAVIALSRGLRPVTERFAVASDIAQTIRNTVGTSGAAVKHLGDGVFSFEAEVSDAVATRAAVDRVAQDLAPLVKRIDTRFETTTPGRLPTEEKAILSRLTAEGISVVHGRDGVKHLVIAPTISARDALGLTSTIGLRATIPPKE